MLACRLIMQAWRSLVQMGSRPMDLTFAYLFIYVFMAVGGSIVDRRQQAALIGATAQILAKTV